MDKRLDKRQWLVFLGIMAFGAVLGVTLIALSPHSEPMTRLTPIECYLGRTLVYKGVMRGDYFGDLGRQGRGQLWRFTDHQTGKIVAFGGFCQTGVGEYVPTAIAEKGALPKNMEVW